MELFDCNLEVYINQQTQISRLTAPRMIIEHQFLSLINQVAHASQPVKLRLYRTESTYEQLTQSFAQKKFVIEYKNNAFVQKYGE